MTCKFKVDGAFTLLENTCHRLSKNALPFCIFLFHYIYFLVLTGIVPGYVARARASYWMDTAEDVFFSPAWNCESTDAVRDDLLLLGSCHRLSLRDIECQ